MRVGMNSGFFKFGLLMVKYMDIVHVSMIFYPKKL